MSIGISCPGWGTLNCTNPCQRSCSNLIAGPGVRVLRLLERVQEARRHLRLRGAARARGQRARQHAALRPRPVMIQEDPKEVASVINVKFRIYEPRFTQRKRSCVVSRI